MTKSRPDSPGWWGRVFRAPHDRIFISYRREDGDAAWWLAASLRAAFHDERVFMDTRDIEPSRDFAAEVQAQLQSCSVVVALIGPAWKRRIPDLHSEKDWVRRELSLAMASGAVVIPVLNGITASELVGLPPALGDLLKCQAVSFVQTTEPDSSQLHSQWDSSLNGLRRMIRKSSFRRQESRLALSMVGLLSLTLALLALIGWVYVSPLTTAMYVGAGTSLFVTPVGIAAIALAVTAIGVSFLPHATWSLFANLGRSTHAIAILSSISLLLLGALYNLRPLAISSGDASQAYENPCDSNYQVKRFDDAGNARNPCAVEFADKLTLIEMRIGSKFPNVAKAQIDISVVGGRIKAIRVPNAMTIVEDAHSNRLLSLPFELTEIQGISTPFVVWIVTEPKNKPVRASLIVGGKQR